MNFVLWKTANGTEDSSVFRKKNEKGFISGVARTLEREEEEKQFYVVNKTLFYYYFIFLGNKCLDLAIYLHLADGSTQR